MTVKVILKKIKFSLEEKDYSLIIQLEKKIDKEKKDIKTILNALKKSKIVLIFTLPNSDPLSDQITNEIYKFKNKIKKMCNF